MKRFSSVFFAAILGFALVVPGILEARGGHGGGRGHSGGSHGRSGTHKGTHGGFHKHGGTSVGFGAAFSGAYYLAPGGWYYPAYYPDSYNNAPPQPYDQSPLPEGIPPEILEFPPFNHEPGSEEIFPPFWTDQVPPN
jgi:hypothetical protein